MFRSGAVLIGALALVGCEATGGSSGGTSGTGVKLTESGTKRGSAGGFAQTLAQEIGAPEGSLGAAAPGAAPAASTSDGSAAVASAGSAATPADSPAPAGSAAPAAAAVAKDAAAAPAGSAAPAAAVVGNDAAASGSAAAAAAAPAAAPASAPSAAKMAKRVYMKPSAELAAIKLELEPNWERDYGEAGTFSLVVKVPNTDDTRVFAVRYGYDDPSAPFDCDQYRKFLEEKKVPVTLNRQRSGACYIEATDKTGAFFRYMINYGGKRLMCQGSLYKDAASASLGDLRDKVLMQAKKICETLAL